MSPPYLCHVPRTISSPIVQCLWELELVLADNSIGDNDHQRVAVKELTFEDLKTESYRAEANPMGTVPAFRDEDFGIALYESGAVLDYLLESYDVDYRLRPRPVVAAVAASHVQRKSQVVRARYLQLKQYVLVTVYPLLSSLVLHITTKPIQEQDIGYIRSAQNKWTTVIGPF